MDNAGKLAVIVSPRLSVEALFTAKSLCDRKHGTLYYLPGEKADTGKFPYAKIRNSANAAVLKKLAAKPWDNPEVDCILLVGACLEARPPGSARIIAMSNFKYGVEADVQIPLADPLRSEGAVITDDGHLAFLKTDLPVGDDLTTHSLLASLGGLTGFGDIASIRKMLAGVVSELDGLLGSNAERLVKTGLEPHIIDVAPDCREVAFEKLCESKGL
ncbi:MAG: hypothetical protein GY941_10975, partial [Planctomycetes bacterium]|nr:hypothetical protein [Planctomycetota bacterium]